MKDAISRFFGVGENEPEPEEMSFPIVRVLILLSIALGVGLIASNLAALKIWNLFGIPVDAGIWLFPLTYVAGDLLVEIFGKKIANWVAIFCSLFAVVTAVVLWFAKVALPDFPGVDNSAFEIAQSATGRIFLASVIGFLTSQLVNNAFFVWLRRYIEANEEMNDGAKFQFRAVMSSMLAHLVDSVTFEIIAFIGRVPADDLFMQLMFAYAAGLVIETVLSGLTRRIAMRWRWSLSYTNGMYVDD